MKKIAIPIWKDCVSNVFDFADTVQMILLEDSRMTSRCDIIVAGMDSLERSNRLIVAEPDILLCGAISRRLADRIRIASIEVVSMVCGPIDRVVEAYLNDELAQPEFRLPGCKTGNGHCARRRRGPCGRHH